MARRPLVLGQEQFSVAPLAPYRAGELRLPNAVAPPSIEQGPTREQRAAGASGLVDALDAGMTRPLEGGGLGEALARFGESYLRTRAAGETRLDEEMEELRERNREEQRRRALAEAVAAYDPTQPAQTQNAAMIRALGGGAPEEALGLMQGDVQGRLEQERQQQGARDQYAWQRRFDNENPEAITPYQQAQLDLSRRGQDISAANARATRVARPLRGPDATFMTDTRAAATSARGLRGLVQDFLSQMESAGGYQGPGSGVQIWNPHTRAMTALAARMTGLMRPAGSGATSDFEQRLYARGAPSVDNTPEANREIATGLMRAADIMQARQFFFEMYAETYGTLNGAEQAFQQSPEFRALTGEQAAGGGQTQQQGPGFDNGRSMTTVDIHGRPIR